MTSIQAIMLSAVLLFAAGFLYFVGPSSGERSGSTVIRPAAVASGPAMTRPADADEAPRDEAGAQAVPAPEKEVSGTEMTPERIIALVEKYGDGVEVRGNMARFTFHEVPLVLVFDPRADRMRLMSPIMPVANLEAGMLEKAMAANFDTVLDARYAVSRGVVWSAFIHPLSDLSESLLASAISQVAVARVTFGREYTSGGIRFGEPGKEGRRGLREDARERGPADL